MLDLHIFRLSYGFDYNLGLDRSSGTSKKLSTQMRRVIAYLADKTEVPGRNIGVTLYWYTLTYTRGTLRIGCIRFKHGRIPRHTVAYGETETDFFKHA